MLQQPGRARRLIFAAATAGFLIRLAFALFYWVGKPLTHDEREYLELARSLSEGRGFVYAPSSDSGPGPRFGRAPGYPMLLAVIGAGSSDASDVPVPVKVAQSAAGAVGVWLIGIFALRAAGPRAGIAAAAIASVYPPLVWICAYALSEAVYSVLAVAAALVLQIAVERAAAERSSRAGGALALGAGVLTGIAVLVRPAMLLFLPLAVVWLLFRRLPILAVALVAASVAVVTPWTARNMRVHGRFVLVASEGGVTFWTGNHPLSRGEGDLAANPDIKRAEIEFRRTHPGLTSEELEPLYYREALGYIARHPVWWAGLVARKAFYTVVPAGPSYTLHSTRYWAASLASYLLLLIGAAFGIRRLWSAPRRPTALFVLAGSACLTCLIFFPQERFRIPVLDPALIVCAGAAAGRRQDS